MQKVNQTMQVKTHKKCVNPTIKNDSKTQANIIITHDNITTLAQRFTIRTFKTLISRSPMPFYHKLYNSLCKDIKHINAIHDIANYVLSDSYDIVQVASIAILQYLNMPLNHVLRIEKKTKNDIDIEKPITIKIDIYRAINRYIMSLRAVELKQNVCVDNYDGEYVQVPFKWDIDTYTDFEKITIILDGLNLTDRQDKILKYRLRGLSVKAIAKYVGVSRQSIMKTMGQIQNKLPIEYQAWGQKIVMKTKQRELLRQQRKQAENIEKRKTKK